MFLSEAFRRLLHVGRRQRFEDDLGEELRFHLESRIADLEAAGKSRAEAQRQARREFGPIALVSENSRAAWQFQWAQDLAADLRHTLRGCRRNPAFTITA